MLDFNIFKSCPFRNICMNLQIFYPQWNYEFKFRVWQADSILIQGPDSHFPKNTIYMSQETCKVRNIIWANPARKWRTKSNILAEILSILADFYKFRNRKNVNNIGKLFQWPCNWFSIEDKFVPWMCHYLKQFSFSFLIILEVTSSVIELLHRSFLI